MADLTGGDYIALSGNGSSDHLLVTYGGNVGIGRSPSYTLDVSGTIRGNNVSPSDKRYKENIKNINSSLDKVLSLQGSVFNWKTKEYSDKNFPEGDHFGMVAQDLEKVLPEVVYTDADGMKSVAYNELIPVLIEAIKEQQKTIDSLTQRLTSLETSSGSGKK